MKITRLNKSLAALVILFFFVLGAVAVSNAHESPLNGEVQGAAERFVIDDAPARLEEFADGFLWQLPAGDLPSSGHNHADRSRIVRRFAATVAQVLANHHRAPKVSLHMLQSILLL